jgi:hypothetical protein
MARWYAPADYTAASMTDGHALKFCSKAQRLSTPEKYGAVERSLPWVETDCPNCTRDLDEPRNGFHRDPSKVNLTMAEMEYQLGKATKARTTIESLREQLAALDNTGG